MKILNIAAGKLSVLPFRSDNLLIPKYILDVDTSYFSTEQASSIETEIESWEKDPDAITTHKKLSMDIFEFMERTTTIFDRVVAYRFLEHVSFTQVEYFIYLVSTVLKKGALVDIIVPNYETLAQMIMTENSIINTTAFKAWNILLTTEVVNEPSCPHASIWTPGRIKYFWELEKRFKVKEILFPYEFDGRDIYLRAKIERA